MAEKGKLVRVGALWLRDGRKGKFMSGEINFDGGEPVKVLVFKNKHKELGDKRPDYEVFCDQAEYGTEAANVPPIPQHPIPADDDVPF